MLNALLSAELAQVCMIAVFMAISPGADFAMITRNSLFYSRRAGLLAALGVASATWVHTAYTLAGLVVLMASSVWVFTAVKWAGGLYLIYIGWKTWKSRLEIPQQHALPDSAKSDWAYFRQGFITNATNPKTTLFYLSIFTQVVNPDTSLAVQLLYGLIISLAHGLWFSALAIGITHQRVLEKLRAGGRHIGRALGGALMAMGVGLMASHR
ncbi:LysE family transporter [Hahella sp. CR1]|uniref:LysE family translocator n=1 Tax=Hahella sp. CR1 TaxID=2992807 RepID=UPI002442507E|nr:LysE family transporter [Hahella sp. CR1]MDG9670124.1 LysE family transporter [Hahella sp. CR1]